MIDLLITGGGAVAVGAEATGTGMMLVGAEEEDATAGWWAADRGAMELGFGGGGTRTEGAETMGLGRGAGGGGW